MTPPPSRREAAKLLAGAVAVLTAAPASLLAAEPEGDSGVLGLLLATIYGPGSEALDAVAAMREGLGWLSEDRQELIALLPGIVEEGSRVLVPTWSAFSALSAEGREQALDDWATSDLGFRRQVYGALRLLLLFHAYTDPQTWPSIGYPGPWLGRVPLPVHPLRFGEPA